MIGREKFFFCEIKAGERCYKAWTVVVLVVGCGEDFYRSCTVVLWQHTGCMHVPGYNRNCDVGAVVGLVQLK